MVLSEDEIFPIRPRPHDADALKSQASMSTIPTGWTTTVLSFTRLGAIKELHSAEL